MFKKAVNIDAVPIVIESKNEQEEKPKAAVAPQRSFKVLAFYKTNDHAMKITSITVLV